MEILNVNRIKRFALLMAILLISNFLFGVAIAADGDGTITSNVGESSDLCELYSTGIKGIFGDNIDVEVSGNGETTIFKCQDTKLVNNGQWLFDWVMKENSTGVYLIEVHPNEDEYEENGDILNPIRYVITRANRKDQKVNGFDNSLSSFIYNTGNFNEDTVDFDYKDIREGLKGTAVKVILEEGFHYGIKFDSKALVNKRIVTVTLTREIPYNKDISEFEGNWSNYGYSNIPSSYFTMKTVRTTDQAIGSPKSNEYNESDEVKKSPFPTYTLNSASLKELADGVQATDSKDTDQKPSWIESALVEIIIFFGQAILWIAEKSLNVDSLTMDNLIFNNLGGKASPVVDLSKYGGIQISSVETGSIMNNAKVVKAVGEVFKGFRYVACIIYILSLLFMGVKMILAVGTPDESKSKKFIQYWLTGALLLYLGPTFSSCNF